MMDYPFIHETWFQITAFCIGYLGFGSGFGAYLGDKKKSEGVKGEDCALLFVLSLFGWPVVMIGFGVYKFFESIEPIKKKDK